MVSAAVIARDEAYWVVRDVGLTMPRPPSRQGKANSRRSSRLTSSPVRAGSSLVTMACKISNLQRIRVCFGNFIQISLVSLGQRRAEIARAGCQGYINLKLCSKIRNTDTIISFAFLNRVTIHFYQSRRFIRSHFCHKAGAKWSKISETKGNAKQNMESDRAKFAGKISKRPEQIWAWPNERAISPTPASKARRQ